MNMSIFNEKSYDFFTQPDNWKIASEISEKVNYVQGRLLKEFWTKVKETILSKMDNREWKLDMSENLYEPYSNLSISKASWNELFGLGFEELESATYIGVWYDFDSKRVEPTLYDKIANDIKIMDKRMVKTDWWPGYYLTGDNFSQSSTIEKILPSNRDALVKKYVDMLFELQQKAQPIIDSF